VRIVNTPLERLQRASTGIVSRSSLSNLGAQGGALASVTVASLLVARFGGPAVVGEYALFRVLPWLFGVVFSIGLPTASAFFLAGEHAEDPDLRPTLVLMTVCGASLGAVVWMACAGVFHALFFRHVPMPVIIIMALCVMTQLCTVTAKGCCQGSHDIAGANLVIVAEELWFVVCFPAVVVFGHLQGIAAVATGLISSGLMAAGTGVIRLVRRGFFEDFGRPSASLASRIAAFGARGQFGNLLWLTNLRFDFILLGALAGPAVLGVYSIASKFAELMRLAPTALNYVLYPRFAQLGKQRAATAARSLFPKALLLTVALTPLVALAALFGPHLLYGAAFSGAVTPAEIIILGLSIEGAAAVASAYLLGTGRPGLNSLGMGVGAVVTVGLDVALIPRYGALGGAITSAVVYATTTVTLSLLASRLASKDQPARHAPGAGPSGLGADSMRRRVVDVVVALVALLVAAPVMALIALAIRLTSPGPTLYRQVRVGRFGRRFVLLKFRSMVVGAERLGGYITQRNDARVTPVGRLLRASKLDELPQLFNVLRGDMTLIGPRPEVPYFVRWYNPDELQVLSVRPGLTGWGQVLYPGDHVDASGEVGEVESHYLIHQLHQKLLLDLAYLRRRGFWADLAIVGQTVRIIVQNSVQALAAGRGASTPQSSEVLP
jgi:lipopolysaccharide/colanic/teichoic acid biosynthesis glycosyltransferase/Na+-driven multidrug efflux pump